jgi:hypothetical protein
VRGRLFRREEQRWLLVMVAFFTSAVADRFSMA